MRKTIHWVGGILVALALTILGYQNPNVGWWLLYAGVWLWILSHRQTTAILRKLLAYGRSGTTLLSFATFAFVGIGGGLLLSTSAWVINRYFLHSPKAEQNEVPGPVRAERFRTIVNARIRREGGQAYSPFFIQTGEKQITIADVFLNIQVTSLLTSNTTIETFDVEMETTAGWKKLQRLEGKIFGVPTVVGNPNALDLSNAKELQTRMLFIQLENPLEPAQPVSGSIFYKYGSRPFPILLKRIKVTIREATGLETEQIVKLPEQLTGDPVEKVRFAVRGKVDLSKWKIIVD